MHGIIRSFMNVVILEFVELPIESDLCVYIDIFVDVGKDS